MKPANLLILALTFALSLGGFHCAAPAQEADPNLAAAKEYEALFFRLYPDLAVHKDIVTASTTAIVAEGYKASIPQMFARMAADTRAALQARNSKSERPQDDPEFTTKEEAARREAQQQFPQVLVPNSLLDRRVRQERSRLTTTYPAYFANPQWPLYLTQGCAAAIEEEAKQRMNASQQQPRAAQPQQQQNLTLEQLQQIVDIYTKLQQMTNTQDQASLDMIERLQALRGSRSRTRQRQTPAEVNAWWQQYQQQQKLNQLQSELERLRQQQR